MMSYVHFLAGHRYRAGVFAVIAAIALLPAATTQGDDAPAKLDVLPMKINVFDTKLLNAGNWPAVTAAHGSDACRAYVLGNDKTSAGVMLVPNHLGHTEVIITTPDRVFVYRIHVVQDESDKPEDNKGLPEIRPTSEDLAVGESAIFEFPMSQINTLCTQRRICSFELDGLDDKTHRALRVRRISSYNLPEFAAVVWQGGTPSFALYRFGVRTTSDGSK